MIIIYKKVAILLSFISKTIHVLYIQIFHIFVLQQFVVQHRVNLYFVLSIHFTRLLLAFEKYAGQTKLFVIIT